MTGRPSVLLAAAVVLPALAGCAEAEPSAARLGAATSAIQGGTTDTAHSYVVGIASRAGGVCTGTLIAPNLVLTARHCVVQSDGSPSVTCRDTFGRTVPASYLYVTTSPTLDSRNARFYEATSVKVPTESGFCGNDIALVTLAQNIPESEAVPAIPVVHVPMSDPRFARVLTVLGYGATSASQSGPGAGIRRIKSDIDMLCIPGDPQGCGRLPNYMTSDSDREFITEGGTCSGDSGGPAFDQVSFRGGSAPYVFGALSRGPQYENRCLEAVYTRTDAFSDMIVETAKAAAAAGGYPEPAWVDPSSWTSAEKPGTQPAPKVDGEACEADGECASGACVDGEAGPVCTPTCAEDADCAEGLVCSEDGLCVAEPVSPKKKATAPANQATSGESASSGCSAAGRADGRSGLGAVGLALGVAAVLGRRRRR